MFTMPSPSLEMRREIEMQSKRLEEMKVINSNSTTTKTVVALDNQKLESDETD